jgi:hypothetical protein
MDECSSAIELPPAAIGDRSWCPFLNKWLLEPTYILTGALVAEPCNYEVQVPVKRFEVKAYVGRTGDM